MPKLQTMKKQSIKSTTKNNRLHYDDYYEYYDDFYDYLNHQKRIGFIMMIIMNVIMISMII